MSEKEHIGGQAVIEGVLMKSAEKVAVAVRKQDNSIVVKKESLKKNKSRLANMIFARGVFRLVEMLKLGITALTWSGNQAYDEQEELSNKELFFIVLSSFVFSILIFTLIPYVLTSLKIAEIKSPFLFNFVDGIIKIVMFFLYVVLISLMPDVKRLFEYHGAEHKVVNCLESGNKLTMKNIKKFSTIHARCGTHFLMLLFIISIIIFSSFPSLMNILIPRFGTLSFILQKIILFVVRVLFIPITAGISYEFLKFFANHEDNILVKAISYPGLMMQKLTTQEPDESQIKVALKAINAVLE